MKRILTLAILTVFAGAAPAEEHPTVAAAAPKAPQGPRVRVTPTGEGSAFEGYLLSFKDGVLDLELPSGERRTEKSEQIQALDFVKETKAPSIADAIDDDPIEYRPMRLVGPNAEAFRRIRELRQKYSRDGLTPAEKDELKSLKRRLPTIPLPEVLPPRRRMEFAEESARMEAADGKIDEHIAQMREKLRIAESDREIEDALTMLIFAYRQKGQLHERWSDMVLRDIANVMPRKRQDTARRILQDNVLYYAKNYKAEEPKRKRE